MEFVPRPLFKDEEPFFVVWTLPSSLLPVHPRCRKKLVSTSQDPFSVQQRLNMEQNILTLLYCFTEYYFEEHMLMSLYNLRWKFV